VGTLFDVRESLLFFCREIQRPPHKNRAESPY
jgi:hypothetical protein